MTNKIIYSALFLFTICLSACATNNAPAGEAAYKPTEYTLAPDDLIKISVFGEERFNNEYKISSDGDISFPLIGNVKASGLSASTLKSNIESSLSEGFLNEPRVTLEIVNYRPFFIRGEVKRPGRFEYSNGLTVLQALALAGDVTYRADQRKVYIRRSGDQQEKVYDLLDGRDIYVAPGDIIRIGERYF